MRASSLSWPGFSLGHVASLLVRKEEGIAL